MISGFLPFPHNDGEAQCVMLYDWENADGVQWIEFIEHIFAEFGQFIFEGSGSLNGVSSHGKYSKVKKRLVSFLKDANQSSEFDIRILSEREKEPEPFFPSSICVAVSGNSRGRKKAVLAVRKELITDSRTLLDRVGKSLFNMTGKAYGCEWNFPASYGPDSYLSGINTLHAGMKLNVNREYAGRLMHWRDNVWRGVLSHKNGYFREVYSTNFILDSHLRMPFRGEPFRCFVEEYGDLDILEYHNEIYKWVIPEVHLHEVQTILETSGLVLSSSSKPIFLN